MKRLFTFVLMCLSIAAATAQERVSTDARTLTVVGKLFDTQMPYHRLDSADCSSLTDKEAMQAAQSSGIAIAFSTDSDYIGVDVTYEAPGYCNNSPQLAIAGFDLYIKSSKGEYVWAGNGVPDEIVPGQKTQVKLLKDIRKGWKECLVYLPLFSSISDLRIVTSANSSIQACANPFKARIALFGSSYTQGSGAGRPAMTYCAQLQRMTGYQFINMGFCGNSKLQPYFADILCKAEVDAYVCDAFSNPTPEQMRERLFPFIEKLQASKPGIPIIFIKSVWREERNFSLSYDASEEEKASVADSLMRIATARYKDVYWVTSTSTIGKYHECTSDGSHPDSHGYTLMAESLRKDIVRILSKYIK